MNLYRKIIRVGVQHVKDRAVKKRIKLLNTYIVIWMHLSLFFIVLDIIFKPPNQINDIIVHTISLLVLSFLLFLNHINKFKLSRILYVLLSFVVFYTLSFLLSFSSYTVCYFIFLPLVVMSLYKGNKLAYIFCVLCLLVYNWNDLLFLEEVDGQFLRCIFLIKDPVVTSLFVASFTLFHYFKKLNQENEEQLQLANQKLEETRKSEVAHLQLKSLKAQMNPHFMFNAMNSIQSLILKGDKHEAYQYLSKFSLLIRENLNMSEKSFVSFEEELFFLRNYLALEKLRLGDMFSYTFIGVNDIGDIRIPSMIIQPFVENAIKHGLFHLVSGKEKLEIQFEQKEVFYCTISDNGIGLKKANEINSNNNVSKEFISTNTIIDRLKLLKDYYKTDIGIEYIPVAIGTKVIVKIPYTLNNE